MSARCCDRFPLLWAAFFCPPFPYGCRCLLYLFQQCFRVASFSRYVLLLPERCYGLVNPFRRYFLLDRRDERILIPSFPQ